MSKTYVVLCDTKKQADNLFKRMCDYLIDEHIRARAMKLTFTIDFPIDHDKIIFKTTTDGISMWDNDVVLDYVVERFLDQHESSKEAARITEAMYDML